MFIGIPTNKSDNDEVESKDIQHELIELVRGMSTLNIYSQVTYFLVALAVGESNPRTPAHELSQIHGLLSDSYFGKLAFGQISEYKSETKE